MHLQLSDEAFDTARLVRATCNFCPKKPGANPRGGLLEL